MKSLITLTALALGARLLAADASLTTPGDPPHPAESDSAAADKADKTGTNPLNFQTTLSLKNEFNRISDRYANLTRLTYSHPLLPNWKIGVELPFLASDASGSDQAGLSDVVLKTSWIPYATRKMGLALGADLTTPTATQDVLGTEKWQLAPSLTAAFFLPHSVIFAPAYKHGFSFAGEDDRADIHTGTLDFYLVWKFDRSRQWLTLDPTLLFDYENDRYESATVRLTYGRVLGKVGEAVLSGFIKPDVGVGCDRPNDWSLEAGVSLIGF